MVFPVDERCCQGRSPDYVTSQLYSGSRFIYFNQYYWL